MSQSRCTLANRGTGISAAQLGKSGGRSGEGSGREAFFDGLQYAVCGRAKERFGPYESATRMVSNPYNTGCHILIADGLKGSDDVEVPVSGGEYVKTAKIGRAVMDADVFVSLTHFKGHEQAGMGGTLKNIGMGCGSRAGKMEMHSSGKPVVKREKCVGCRACAIIAPTAPPQFDRRARRNIDINQLRDVAGA